MKKFINHPESVVEEMLQGLAALHPQLTRLPGYKVMYRTDIEQVRDQQTAIISGGGSGHEPAHAGYIGAGMLSAAVAGEVFTSPSSDSILAAIKAVAGSPGVLLVIKNYTGDRLNFGVAAEMARSEGIPVETIIVNDDVALAGKAQNTGARGLAGTVFLHKLVGAAAAEGRSLEDVAAIGATAIKSLATMSVSLSAGTSPAVGKPSFELGANEMELGLGIHGEPGVSRTHLQPAAELTETLLAEILKNRRFGDEKRVAVMINNLGATTEMELAIVARHSKDFLEGKGYTVERIYAGTFLSSLDMAGISISVLGVNDLWLRWLDAPTTAPAWPNVSKQRPGMSPATLLPNIAAEGSSQLQEVKTETGRRVKRAIDAACNALIEAEEVLTEMDRVTGDGDLGASMKRGAIAVQKVLDSYPVDDVPATFRALGRTLQRELGGSSGPFYGVFFLRCANALSKTSTQGAAKWVEAFEEGCRAITELGGAKPGDRTMLDALDPFVRSLKKTGGEHLQAEILESSVQAAERGADATAQMIPRVGRSSYLGDRVLGHSDPGAQAVAIWLRACVSALLEE